MVQKEEWQAEVRELTASMQSAAKGAEEHLSRVQREVLQRDAKYKRKVSWHPIPLLLSVASVQGVVQSLPFALGGCGSV